MLFRSALKAQGNAAFSAKEYTKAISLYSDAIEMDSENYTLYSNRSGAYCAAQKYQQAAADARKVIQLKPDWVRGYTRLGAACQGLENWDEAEEAFKKALEIDPNNANAKADLATVQKMKNQTNNEEKAGLGNLFNPQMFDMLRYNPKIAPYFNDPSFARMIEDIKADPKNFSKYQNDQRLQIVMQAILEEMLKAQGINPNAAAQETEAKDEEEPKEEKVSEPKEETPAPEKKPTHETKQDAENEKLLGNEAFKKGDLEEAIKHYDAAIKIDPVNVLYYTNKSSALSKQKKYQEAIDVCEEAIKIGRENQAPYEHIARAYQKISTNYVVLGKLQEAIDALSASLLEKQDPLVRREKKRLEDLLVKKKAAEYENPELAEKAKNEGNEHFKNGQFPEAIECYTEAIKRAPRNPALYSNRAAAYTKLGEMPMAIKDCEKAIEIDPKFAKGYTRKAYCHFRMKEYSKARDAYNEALKVDPNNADAIDGLQSIDKQIAKNRYQAPDQEQIRRSMSDPEIQRILQDPGMQQILQEIQQNPMSAQRYLQEPKVREALMKLQAAGIIR